MDDEHGPLPKRRMVNLLLSENNEAEHSSNVCDSDDGNDKYDILQDFNNLDECEASHNDSSSSGDNEAVAPNATLSKDKCVFFRSTGSVVEEKNGLVFNVAVKANLQHSDDCLGATKAIPNQNEDSSLSNANVLIHNRGNNMQESEATHDDNGYVNMDKFCPLISDEKSTLDEVAETPL